MLLVKPVNLKAHPLSVFKIQIKLVQQSVQEFS